MTKTNSKHEILNPKQYLITKIPMIKRKTKSLDSLCGSSLRFVSGSSVVAKAMARQGARNDKWRSGYEFINFSSFGWIFLFAAIVGIGWPS